MFDFSQIKNFIWDFDGTLYDTYPYTIDCFMKALKESGVDADPIEVYTLMMTTIEHAFTVYEKRYNLGNKLRETYGRIRQTTPHTQGGPFPYAVRVLERVIQTGGENYMFTHRENDVYDIMEHFDTLKYFKDIATLAGGFALKPSPEGIDYLIEKHNFDRKKTIMIGDREIDIKSGENAGVYTCHITNGLPYGDFSTAIRVNGLKDIFDLLEGK